MRVQSEQDGVDNPAMGTRIWSATCRSSRREPMMTVDRIAELLRASSLEFRQLEETHHRLDAELAELQKRHVLTPHEEFQKKRIQKEKLAKKDKMAELVRLYREHEAR